MGRGNKTGELDVQQDPARAAPKLGRGNHMRTCIGKTLPYGVNLNFKKDAGARNSKSSFKKYLE